MNSDLPNPTDMFTELFSDLDSIPDPHQFNAANQRKWTFDFDSVALKRDFLASAAAKNITAGSLANRLIHAYLIAEGKDHPKPNLVRAGRGRPLGSQNLNKSHQTAPAANLEPQRVTEPRTKRRNAREKLPDPVPTHEEIEFSIMDSGYGLYPVGNPRRLTDEDKRILRREASQGRSPKGLWEATYVDEAGNYFDDNWGWWWKSYFAGNVGSNKAQLVVWAIQRGDWFPDDPNDYRIDRWLREKLFDEHGNRREGVVLEKSGVQLEQFEQSDDEN